MEEPALAAATSAVRDAVDAAVRINKVHSSHLNARGISIHFPGPGDYFLPTYLAEPAPWSGNAWGTFLAAFSMPLPSTWTCEFSAYGGDDVCNCGCGGWDPDCEAAAETHGCNNGQLCVLPGVCQESEATACPGGALQCAGDLLLAACADDQWGLNLCTEIISCPGAPLPGAICWEPPDGGPPDCRCVDDPMLCTGIECGDNGFGQSCGACQFGYLCHQGTCLSQGECSGGFIPDCAGYCAFAGWLSDDECDNGPSPYYANFNCTLYDHDGGDCGR